jgi:hypothetical protein
MDDSEQDPEFDALLHTALAPPERPIDAGFVARVDRAVAEGERYRRRRASLLRQLGSEALAVAALGASLVYVAQAPAVQSALATTPELVWPALLSLLLLWILMRGRGDAFA